MEVNLAGHDNLCSHFSQHFQDTWIEGVAFVQVAVRVDQEGNVLDYPVSNRLCGDTVFQDAGAGLVYLGNIVFCQQAYHL